MYCFIHTYYNDDGAISFSEKGDGKYYLKVTVILTLMGATNVCFFLQYAIYSIHFLELKYS